MSGVGFKVRFELPRAQLDLGQTEAADHAADFESFARASGFDSTHLLGRIHFDIARPFETDPVLTFLKERRGLAAEPPLTISLDQPVAYLLGQLAGAAVLALHGEGARLVPLTGGKGAVGLEAEGGNLLISLPLDAYAGSVAVPAAEAALAFADACASLESMLRTEAPALAGWSLLTFLRREERILRASATRPSQVAPGPDARLPAGTLDVARLALRGAPSLTELAAEAEQCGAHVVPYWDVRAADASGAVAFTPLVPPAAGPGRGALARLIFPGLVRTIEAGVGEREADTTRLRSRLARPRPFNISIDPSDGQLRAIQEDDRGLHLV